MEILKNNDLNKKGILVEYDAGYISPKDNRHFINEINKLTKGEQIIEDPLVVYAVMQKYGVENFVFARLVSYEDSSLKNLEMMAFP